MRIKMPVATEVGLGPGDIMLDGDAQLTPPPKKGHGSPPLFGPCLLWPNGRPSQQPLPVHATYRSRQKWDMTPPHFGQDSSALGTRQFGT